MVLVEEKYRLLTCGASFFVRVIPAIIMTIAPPTRQYTGVRIITLDNLHSRLPVFIEVHAVGIIASHLVRGVRAILVVIAPVQREDTRVVGPTFKLVVATATAELVRSVAAVVDVVAAFPLADAPAVGAVKVAGRTDTGF